MVCNNTHLALFDVPREISRGLPPVSINYFAVLLAGLCDFPLPGARAAAMIADIGALQNRDRHSAKFGGVFDDCQRSSVSLGASAYAAATLQQLRRSLSSLAGAEEEVEAGGYQLPLDFDSTLDSGGANGGGGGGRGVDTCWGWSCLNVSKVCTSSNTTGGDCGPDTRRHDTRRSTTPPGGGVRDALDFTLLECFLGRAPTDLFSAYLAHFAVSSSPFLLARYFQTALSYQFEGPGRQEVAPVTTAFHVSAVRSEYEEIVTGNALRPLVSIKTFAKFNHPGFQISLTACHVPAAIPAEGGSGACDEAGSKKIVEDGRLAWHDATKRYRSLLVIPTDGFVGLMTVELGVWSEVVGLGKLSFKVMETRKVCKNCMHVYIRKV